MRRHEGYDLRSLNRRYAREREQIGEELLGIAREELLGIAREILAGCEEVQAAQLRERAEIEADRRLLERERAEIGVVKRCLRVVHWITAVCAAIVAAVCYITLPR